MVKLVCKKQKKFLLEKGFFAVESAATVAVVGLLALVVVAIPFLGLRHTNRDTQRKADIAEMVGFMKFGCYIPEAGPGEYDFIDVANELFIKKHGLRKLIKGVAQDPKTGTPSESKYIYVVSVGRDSVNCAIYANLENEYEPITLPITVPTPEAGSGAFRAEEVGWNGSPVYYQFSVKKIDSQE